MQFLLGHIHSWENTSCHLRGFLKVCLKKRLCLFLMDPVSYYLNIIILFGVVFRTISRIKDSIFFIFPSTAGDRVRELDWDTAGLSVCLLVLIALTSCRHLLRAQPAICKIYLVVFFHWAWGGSSASRLWIISQAAFQYDVKRVKACRCSCSRLAWDAGWKNKQCHVFFQ